PELHEGHVVNLRPVGSLFWRLEVHRWNDDFLGQANHTVRLDDLGVKKCKFDPFIDTINHHLAARREDRSLQVRLSIEAKNHYIVQLPLVILADVINEIRPVCNETALGQESGGELSAEGEAHFGEGNATAGPYFKIHQRTDSAQNQAQPQNRADQPDQADAAGANSRELLVGAEAAENQQGGSQHAHGQSEDPGKWHEQTHRRGNRTNAYLATHEQVQDIFEKVSHQQDESEDRECHHEGPENL